MGTSDYDEFVGSHRSRNCDSEGIGSGGNSLNRAHIGSRELENHEALATGLQEGIGLAIDHANQMRLRQTSVEMCRSFAPCQHAIHDSRKVRDPN
jgi:hypothetical protein